MPKPVLPDTFKNQKILITGATGFIGSCLAKELAVEDSEVAVVAREASDCWRINDCLPGLTILDVDLCDYDSVLEAVRGFEPDYIFHLATFGGLSHESGESKIVTTNIMACANLLMAAANTPLKAFVNAGTSSEYGPMDAPMREDSTPAPITGYGRSKLMASLLCQQAALTLGQPAATLRLFSPYGYLEDSKRLIPSVVLPSLAGETLRLGSAASVRDFVFIEDVIEALILAAVNIDETAGEIINIGAGRQHTVGEVVATVQELTGDSNEPEWGAVPPPRHEPSLWQADIAKAETLLGWRPRHDLNAGLAKTVEWYRDNMSKYSSYEKGGC